MRIPSGVTDQYVYFVAVDATDFTSRETGLSSFTVYRSRNGAAAAAMTTPTINETDVTNMQGVYELLLDEDMTIDAGDDEQEMVFHITHAGMAPVTRAITLFRPKVTAGNTLGVESDGDLTKVNLCANTTLVDTLTTLTGHTAQTGDSFARIGATGSGLTSLAQASVLGALATAAATGDPNSAKTIMGYAKQLVNVLAGTAGIATFPAEAAPGNAVSIAEVLRAIHADVTGIAGSAMRGTDSAALASDMATVLSRLSAARAGYLDNLSAGAAALEATLTAMKGATYAEATDSLEALRNRGDAAWITATGFSTHDAANVKTAIEAAGSHLALIKAVTDLIPDAGALTTIGTDTARLTAARAQVLTDLIDGGRLDILIDAIKAVTDLLNAAHAEPTGAPAANETPLDKIAYIFAAIRNAIAITASAKTFKDDAGATLWSKALSDDGTTYTEAEGA